MDLFESSSQNTGQAPLAERMRPKTLDDMVGQQHLLGKGHILRRLIETDQLSSVIFWGPPGTGKTSLAQVIATTTRCRFESFSAVLQGIKEVREILAKAREERNYHGRRTLLFVDEIHRFNKAQQDAFLPWVERGDVILIGATTENPSFEVNSALLSRSQVFVLEPLENTEIKRLLQRALSSPEGLAGKSLQVNEESLDMLADLAHGDARIALNTLEMAAATASGTLTAADIKEAMQKNPLLYDKGAEEHYNVISAFIKSMRGSDADAAVYWLARMVEAGEDPLFIVRRMVIFAAEDIGNADPRALQIAVAAQQAVHFVGMPEGRIPLAQAVTYLATAPKSNAAYQAIGAAQAEIRNSGALPVPLHLRNAPTGLMKELGYGRDYQYAHDRPEAMVEHDHLPERLQGTTYYRPKDSGYEKHIRERLAGWAERRRRPPGKEPST
ncbi:MAG TPA: replication-associated recombination protein A [Desulfuromonadales bacterium]|nr:replication-associated recombination protein A [Desulfuromonadales bacterium]